MWPLPFLVIENTELFRDPAEWTVLRHLSHQVHIIRLFVEYVNVIPLEVLQWYLCKWSFCSTSETLLVNFKGTEVVCGAITYYILYSMISRKIAKEYSAAISGVCQIDSSHELSSLMLLVWFKLFFAQLPYYRPKLKTLKSRMCAIHKSAIASTVSHYIWFQFDLVNDNWWLQ